MKCRGGSILCMYNEEQKLRYLNQCKYEDTTIESIKNYFSSVAAVERFYDKDLSEFIQPQIVDMFKKVNSRSRAYLTSMSIFFADYFNWCLSEGLITDIINKYDTSQTKLIIESVIPTKIIREKYFKKEQMLDYVDKIYDVTNKFIAYALYRGIKGDNYSELIHLRLNDIDGKTKTAKLITGREVIINDMFMELARNADLADYYNADGSTSLDKLRYYGYVDADYILRPMNRNEPQPLTMNMIQNRLKVIKEQSDNEYFTTTTIYKNGLINCIIERHKEKRPDIDLEEILFDQVHGKLYTHDRETQGYINEFGSAINVRMLRRELKDFINCFV